jgi:hypothetical protein
MQPLEIETLNPNTPGKSANREDVALIISQYNKSYKSGKQNWPGQISLLRHLCKCKHSKFKDIQLNKCFGMRN